MISIVASVVAAAALAPAPAQTTAPISVPADGVELAGTLTLPAGPGPHPTAVLISGLGPLDRDSSPPLGRAAPFRSWADALAERGVASIRYDTRGVGESGGDPLAWLDAGRLTEDAAAVARHARLVPGLDSERISIVGHSQGGDIALRAAADGVPLSAVATVGAPGRPIREVAGARPTAPARIEGTAAEAFSASVARDPAADATRVSQPLIVVHGAADRVVPVTDAALLAEAHRGPTPVVRIAGADHFARVGGIEEPIADRAADAIAGLASGGS